jgi:hypothetical protein
MRQAVSVASVNPAATSAGADPGIGRTLDAEWMLTVAAVLAGAVAQSRVDHDGVADNYIVDRRPCRLDDAGRIRPDHPLRRDGDARQPAEQPQVQMVERCSAHAHEHVCGLAQLGVGQILTEREAVDSTVASECEGFQGWSPRVGVLNEAWYIEAIG